MSRAGLRLAACAGALALAACATHSRSPPSRITADAVQPAPPTPDATREVVVRVPVKVACVPRSLGAAPKYPDSAQALRDAGGAADRYQLLAAGRILRERRLAVLERVVEGCRKAEQSSEP